MRWFQVCSDRQSGSTLGPVRAAMIAAGKRKAREKPLRLGRPDTGGSAAYATAYRGYTVRNGFIKTFSNFFQNSVACMA